MIFLSHYILISIIVLFSVTSFTLVFGESIQQNEEVKSNTTLNFSDMFNKTNVSDSNLPSVVIIDSPLKQFNKGIKVEYVKCEFNDHTLIIKISDGSPACVKPETREKLIERGWAIKIVQSIETTSHDLCDGSDIPSGNLKTGTVPVLMMKPNSTAMICVTYQFISDWSSYPNKDLYVDGIFETMSLIHFDLHSDRLSSNNFEVLAEPSMFDITKINNGTRATVMYKIHAVANSMGFYNSSIPYGSCNSYPLAVGYTYSQINATDFAYDLVIPCYYTIAKVDSVKIISGMGFKEVIFS